MVLTDKLSAIGDAIRTKTGGTDLIKLSDMPHEILSISGGGSTTDDRSNCLWATGTWEEIGNVLTEYYAGNVTDITDYFQVGDERVIHNGTWSYVYQTTTSTADEADLTYVIVGTEHDDLGDGSGKAAITVMAKTGLGISMQIIAKSDAGSTTSTTSWRYWDNWLCRTYLANFLNALPSGLTGIIKTVSKVTSAFGSGSYVSSGGQTSGNYNIFLPSITEVSGLTLSGETYVGGDVFDGEIYPYFVGKPWNRILTPDTNALAYSIVTRNSVMSRNSSTAKYSISYYEFRYDGYASSSLWTNFNNRVKPMFCL